MNESFKVYVRIRPMLSREENAGAGTVTCVEDVTDFPRTPPPQRLTLLGTEARSLFGGGGGEGASGNGGNAGGGGRGGGGGGRSGDVSFIFDRCFAPGTQSEVCEMVAAPLVAAVASGECNATLFAYGQTGSGKTYTMEGPVGDEGCVQFAARQLFARLPAGRAIMYQYVQLYNTEFLDLLDPPTEAVTAGMARSKKLSIEEGKRFMCVRGATIATASSADRMLEDVKRGASFRATGATNMNDASSRSHAILIVVVAPEDKASAAAEGVTAAALGEFGTAFYLVDLAGSERTKRSGVSGRAFDEATAINTALSALRKGGDVVGREGWPSSIACELQGQPAHLPPQGRPGRCLEDCACGMHHRRIRLPG